MRIDVVRPFKRPRPEPLPELDDWVGCVGAGAVGGLLAAGLYNGAVCLSRVPEGDGGAPAQAIRTSPAVQRETSLRLATPKQQA